MGILLGNDGVTYQEFIKDLKREEIKKRKEMCIKISNLSDEADRILKEPNAGGNSEKSEAYAMEFLVKTREAHKIFTEMQVKYHYPHWKKCDFITTIDEENVGVSVTRILPPKRLPINSLDKYIASLLHKKLYGLVVSRAGTIEECVFSRSILFAWSPHPLITEMFQKTFDLCTDPLLKEDIELIIVESTDEILREDFAGIDEICLKWI